MYIVDAKLREQLEAEVRNEIRVKSDQSEIRSKEEIRIAELASESRIEERKLATEKDTMRREQERLQAQLEAERDRVASETPVRLFRIENDSAVAREELALQQLQNEVRALVVEGDLLVDRARQALRREMLPIEQAPEIVESASRVLQGTNLSFYGEGTELLGQLTPILDLIRHNVERTAQGRGEHATSAE